MAIQRPVQKVAVKVTTKPAVKPIARPIAQMAKKVAEPETIGGFRKLGKLELPARRHFGRTGGMTEIFNGLEIGEAIEIVVDADRKQMSKMNSIYNAARRVGVGITIRVAESADENGLGGVLHMWYNGPKEAA